MTAQDAYPVHLVTLNVQRRLESRVHVGREEVRLVEDSQELFVELLFRESSTQQVEEANLGLHQILAVFEGQQLFLDLQ